jgi:hypothetical protein
LYGTEKDDKYFVNRTSIPYIYENSDSSCFFVPGTCHSPDYIGMVHNHSDRFPCEPGKTDMRRFKSDNRAKIEVIICNINSEEENFNKHITIK